MSTVSKNVARRFKAFKYEPKESKQTKVDRLMRQIRDITGLSKGVSGDIADAVVRNRDVPRLALQKGWPFEDGKFTGPKGSIPLGDIQSEK